jgi:hypothetical protein
MAISGLPARVPPGLPSTFARWLFVALLVGSASCFAIDQPPCSFACGPGGTCPDDYQCLADGYCHLHGAMVNCGYTDAAVAATPDLGGANGDGATDQGMPDLGSASDLAASDSATIPDVGMPHLPDLAARDDLLAPPDL